jgi:DNA-binding PadR family transcriptional regulator
MPDQSEIPLTETTYFILLSLSARPMHGYAIMKDVEALSAGRVTFGTGTLYGALKRLLDQGWIARSDDPDPDDTARDRKVYALTHGGRAALQAEIIRLESLLSAAELRTAEQKT